ncbi:MAG: FHA domain-containing protein, partial [Planctomycetota bacterium]
MYELQYELNGRQCRIRLEPGTTTLGRAPKNDIVIDDRSVSGQHLRLAVREGEVDLTDLDSSNGTFVNGQRIQSATIRGGETLRLGRLALSIADPDAPADGGGETLVTPAPGAAAAPGPDQTPVHQPAVAPAEPVVQPQAVAEVRHAQRVLAG